jgi:carboxylesterase
MNMIAANWPSYTVRSSEKTAGTTSSANRRAGMISMPGADHAVLLLHGLYGNPLELQYLGRNLNRFGYSVRIPYIDGCGAADNRRTAARSNWQDWLDQARAHFRELRQTHVNVSIGGLCVGANLALALASEPDAAVHSLCLYSTPLAYDGTWLAGLRRWRLLAYHTPLRFLMARRQQHPYGIKDEYLRDSIGRQMNMAHATAVGSSSLPVSGIYQSERLMQHLRRNLHRITAPTLLLHAKEDDTSSPKSADLVAAGIASTEIRKITLNDSFRRITVDRERDRVVIETLAFIARQSAKSSTVRGSATHSTQRA